MTPTDSDKTNRKSPHRCPATSWVYVRISWLTDACAGSEGVEHGIQLRADECDLMGRGSTVQAFTKAYWGQ